jgi:hypothetical protein
MKKLFLSALLIALTGCATPAGTGWMEYNFGATDVDREAELACMRWHNRNENCDIVKLRVIASHVNSQARNCVDVAYAATIKAKELGFTDLRFAYIPGDELSDAHVALVAGTSAGDYVLDNGSAVRYVGTLNEFRDQYPKWKRVHVIGREIDRDEYEFLKKPQNLFSILLKDSKLSQGMEPVTLKTGTYAASKTD